mgnify:FL=1
MSTTFNKSTFETTYKDDFDSADNFHRILFNSGRALQARELTQMQTIIQEEIARFGRNIFKEGAAVNPGGPSVDRHAEFVKLDISDPLNALPADTSTLVGLEFTGATSSIKARVIRFEAASGSDPATLYVQYTDTNTSQLAGSAPVRFTAGEIINAGGGQQLQVQTTNTVANPATGQGTILHVSGGDFFVRGHFVFAAQQSLVISKYTTTGTATVGFTVAEDIVTSGDDTSLFDNQGATPNTASPGADRYRIRLTLVNKTSVTASDNFVYFCDIVDGEIEEVVTGTEDYNKINDVLALRTKEESGNYVVRPFRITFEDDSANGRDSDLIANISAGTVYLNGYRVNKERPSKLTISKPRTTVTNNNEAIGVDYGSYLVFQTDGGSTVGPAAALGNFELVNLMQSSTVIGTARVKSIQVVNNEVRLYLMDIQLKGPGGSNRQITDISAVERHGDFDTAPHSFAVRNTGSTAFLPSTALFRDIGNNDLLFPTQRPRPKSISDVSFQVLRQIDDSANAPSAGTHPSISLSLSATGETFTDVGNWIITSAVTGERVTNFSVSGTGTQSATISTTTNHANGGLDSGAKHNIFARINKGNATRRTKTLTETTITGTIDSDGENLRFVKIPYADVYEVISIKQTDSDGADLSHNFTLDNGQRKDFYQHGRLVVKRDTTPPSGTIFSRLKYFAHGASGDFFSVNSYDGTVDYENIPDFQISGRKSVNLREVIDLRSIRDSDGVGIRHQYLSPDSNGSDSAGGVAALGVVGGTYAKKVEIPVAGQTITADIEYYLPRADKIVINNEAEFSVVSGKDGFALQQPPTPENNLLLFNLAINGYGLNDSDLTLSVSQYKRFRMQDIARIERRLDNLAETTALSLLEQSADARLILDSNGVSRSKLGILADNFKNRLLSDHEDPMYRASINPTTNTLHPAFSNNQVPLIYDSAKSTNTIIKGDNIYLHYTEDSAISQRMISGVENVNPFAVVSGEGHLTLSPTSDNWVDTETRTVPAVPQARNAFPEPVQIGIPTFGNTLGLMPPTFAPALNLGALWNWEGIDLSGAIPNFGNNPGMTSENLFGFGGGVSGTGTGGGVSFVDNFSLNVGTGEAGAGENFGGDFGVRVVSNSTINEVVGDREVSLTAIPFMRPRLIFFRAEGLRGNTRYFPFFDGVKVDDYVNTSGSFTNVAGQTYVGNQYRGTTIHPSGSTTIVTDTNGKVEGSFLLPNNDSLRFRTGDREFKLLDISVDDQSSATSRASAIFTSRGTLETTTVTLRPPQPVPQVNVNWLDPLAQTFRVSAPSGMFVTKIQTYFKAKDATVPVRLELRPVVNGAPSSDDIIPGSVVVLPPSAVQLKPESGAGSEETQANALSNPTTFTFDEPIFLEYDEEYAIVLLSDCNSYEAYVGETYAFQLGSTEKRIDRQPSLGSLFKSQNGTTWTPDQTKDLAFDLFKAQFTTAGGTVVFENSVVPDMLLSNNPISTDSGSRTISVLAPDHGFIVGDTVSITGFDSAGTGLLNGIDSAGRVNDFTHTITAVDGFGYQVELTDSATATGFVGGARVKSSRQILFDTVIPQFDTLVPQDTNITVDAKFTTGRSLAGAETRGTKDTAFSGNLAIKQANNFSAPRMIGTTAFETANIGSGEKSVTIQTAFSTTRADVSPVIDLQRTGMITVSNRIDNQVASGAAAGTSNTPITYIGEDSDGSSLSKHITKVVNLIEPALGLSVIVNARKPSSADFQVWTRVADGNENIFEKPWKLGSQVNTVSSNELTFQDYEFVREFVSSTGSNDPTAFVSYQVKIVMTSTNSSTPPLFRDLRVIATA